MQGVEKLGLFKYSDQLRAARDKVLSDATTPGWAIFAYEGQTNVLKVSDSGDDLEEGFQSLEASKIMYMYTRVVDPNSNLAKYVLINWCGNGAPDMRKAVCATHLPEICRFLGKIHVTMNVRSEDELSVEALQSRVSKASGANYNAGAVVQNTKPVTAPRPSAATGYVRPNAAAEIQASNRDKFWEAHEKDDEAARKAEEARRKTDAQARLAPAKSAKPAVSAGVNANFSASGANGSSSAPQTSAKSVNSALSERDRFWAEQEAEEQRRREEEKRRIEADRIKFEAETREREARAAARREADSRARAEEIAARNKYVQASAASNVQSSANDPVDAARDENERGKRADVAKHARQEEIQSLMRARNSQADVLDEPSTRRAEELRNQRQEEIRKMMSNRAGVDDEEEERRRRAEELRKQREREMQDAFAKRSNTADAEEDERRRRADELRRQRQDEMRNTIGASGSVPASVVATRVAAAPASQMPIPRMAAPPTAYAPSSSYDQPAEPVAAQPSAPRSYVPPMAKQVLPPAGGANVSWNSEPTAPASQHQAPPQQYSPPSNPNPNPNPAGVNPLAAAAAAAAPVYTAQGGNNINDSPNRASQQYFYKASGSAEPSPASSPSKSSRASTGPTPYYANPNNDESQDVYQNVPYVNPSTRNSNFYENNDVNRTQQAQQAPREPSFRSSDLYEPVSFGSPKRSSYRNANDDDADADTGAGDGADKSAAGPSATVRALYDYDAQDQDEISFNVDELIIEVQQIDAGWWIGKNQAGKTGMFPANYVASFSDS